MEAFQRALQALRETSTYTYAADMLVTFDKNMSFYDDARFMAAFNGEVSNEQEASLVWRLHVLCWCAENALRREGDFVECGVYRAFSSRVATRYLDFARQPRQWYLYDTFAGIPQDQLNAGDINPPPYQDASLYEACRSRFAAFPNVHLIRGRVPEVLRERAPDKVAFLHLDMNSARAELGALEVLFERLSPGAFLLLDDYGWRFYREQKLALDAFVAGRGYRIVELPSGQGMLIT